MKKAFTTALYIFVLLCSCVSTPSQPHIKDDNIISFSTNPQLKITISKDLHYTNLRTADTLDFLFASQTIHFYQLSKGQPLLLDHKYGSDFSTIILVDIRLRNPKYPKGQGLKEYFENHVEMGTIIKTGNIILGDTPFVHWDFVKNKNGAKYFARYFAFQRNNDEIIQIRYIRGLSNLDYDELLKYPTEDTEGKRFYGFHMKDFEKAINFSK